MELFLWRTCPPPPLLLSWRQCVLNVKMPNCDLDEKGLLILLSKHHTVDLHFTSGNWGFKLGSWDTKDVFCGPSLALTVKPLCNLGQLNMSGSPCSQVGQAWNSQGAECRAAQLSDKENTTSPGLLLVLLSLSSPHTWGCGGGEGGADSFQYFSEVICYY